MANFSFSRYSVLSFSRYTILSFKGIFFLSGLTAALFITLCPYSHSAEKARQVPCYRVALSPGHGGVAERGRRTTGECWCPDRGKFLKGYSNGTRHGKYTEEKIVLGIARSVKKLLNLTKTEKGWKKFRRLLAGFSKQKSFKRVCFDTFIARNESYDTHPRRGEPNANRFFRNFDSPVKFDKNSKPGKASYPGRFSRLNAFRPWLTVALHLNTSGSPSFRGLQTIITPHEEAFRKIAKAYAASGLKGVSALKCPYIKNWNIPGSFRTRLGWVVSDTSTYYYGYRYLTAKKRYSRRFIGIRHNGVTWPFGRIPSSSGVGSDLVSPLSPRPGKVFTAFPSGAFWTREQSRFEKLRRSGGIMGFGGDNHYAGAELCSFIRYWLYRNLVNQLRARHDKAVKTGKGKAGSKGKAGKIVLKDKAGKRVVKGDKGKRAIKGKTAKEVVKGKKGKKGKAAARKKKFKPPTPKKLVGPILSPGASDWSEPMLLNSVVSYLELGLLSNRDDRKMVLSYPRRYAEAIAVGIYSLFTGLKPASFKGFKKYPRGLPVKWDQYRFKKGEAANLLGKSPVKAPVTYFDVSSHHAMGKVKSRRFSGDLKKQPPKLEKQPPKLEK